MELLDPELQPNVDVTREGYRVYWDVEFAYNPQDDVSPFDETFQCTVLAMRVIWK